MAVRAIGVVDGVGWEGSSTFKLHMVYTILAESNPHGQEIYGDFFIDGMETGMDQMEFNSAICASLRTELEEEHSLVFGRFDTVRVVGCHV